jgi:glycosyltransferase involved in cell wall biosynthesis
MKRKKILYMIGQLKIGGAERQLLELAKRIDRDRFEPLICCTAMGGELVKDAEDAGIPVFVLVRHGKFDLRRVLQLARMLRKEKIDITHSFTHDANMYNVLASALAPGKIVICSERSSGEISEKAIAGLGRFIYRFVDKMIVNSHRGEKIIAQKFKIPTQKIFVVPNGIQLNGLSSGSATDMKKRLRREFGISDGEQIIGLVGNLWQIAKNHGFLLRAAAMIVKSDPRARFILVGGGDRERSMLKNMARELGVSDHIIFTGLRPHEETLQIISLFDIGVLTSTKEGLPNAVMEYMACSKPVVTTDVGGCSELVVNGETGFLVPSGDVNAFAERVLWLLNRTERAREMGRNGRDRILKHFSMEKMVSLTTEIYDSLIS